MPFKKIVSGLTLVFLTACATPSAPPPDLGSLLAPRAKPELQGPLNRDLADAYRLRGVVIDELNADKAAIGEVLNGSRSGQH